MRKLKLCPFCGKNKTHQFRDERYGHTIMCTWCGGRVTSHISREDVIERWNQRKSEDAQEAQI